MTHREQTRAKAVDSLLAAPDGVRFGDLRAQLKIALPHIPPKTIAGNLVRLDSKFPAEVVKLARGLFVHTSHQIAAVPPPHIHLERAEA